MLKPWSHLIAILCMLVSAGALAEEPPAFELQLSGKLEQDKGDPVLLMNKTSKSLALKLVLTPLRMADSDARAAGHELVLQALDRPFESGKPARVDLTAPLQLEPGEVRRLLVRPPEGATFQPGDYVGYLAAYALGDGARPSVIHKQLSLNVAGQSSPAQAKAALSTLIGGALTLEVQCNFLPWREDEDCKQARSLAVSLMEKEEVPKGEFDVPRMRLFSANGQSVLAKVSQKVLTQDSTQRALAFEFERINRPGTYMADIGKNADKTKITLNVAQHPVWLIAMMILGVLLYVITRRLVSWGRLADFLKRCLLLSGEYRKEQLQFEETLREHSALAPARRYDIRPELEVALQELEKEARRLARSKLFLSDQDTLPVEAYERLKKLIEGWSEFGAMLATLYVRMEEANAKPADFIPRASPCLFGEARKLLVGSSLTLMAYEPLREQVKARINQVEEWTALNERAQQLYRECEALRAKTLTAEQASTLKMTTEGVKLAWRELWLRSDYTEPINADGHNVDGLLDTARNTLSKLTIELLPATDAVTRESASLAARPRMTTVTVKQVANAQEVAKMTSDERAQLYAGVGTTTDWALILITMAVTVLVYYRENYGPTWGKDLTDYIAAFTAAYGSQALVAVVGAAFYREPALKLAELIPLRGK